VTSIYARFDVAIFLARRAPLQGLARRLQTKPRFIRAKIVLHSGLFAFHLLEQAKLYGLVRNLFPL
jgi:hypothetical protein